MEKFTIEKFEDLKDSETLETKDQTAEEIAEELDKAIEGLENPKN